MIQISGRVKTDENGIWITREMENCCHNLRQINAFIEAIKAREGLMKERIWKDIENLILKGDIKVFEERYIIESHKSLQCVKEGFNIILNERVRQCQVFF